MTTEETKQNKKPPAHEVIVALLREYAHVIQSETRDASSHNPETAASHAYITPRAKGVCMVLMRMHIPENDRPAVMDALRDLLPTLFGNQEAADTLTEIEDTTRGA